LILVAGTRKSSWNEVSRAWRCSRGESYKQVVQGLINALSLKRGEVGDVTRRFLSINDSSINWSRQNLSLISSEVLKSRY
jgi:hypothetical protein